MLAGSREENKESMEYDETLDPTSSNSNPSTTNNTKDKPATTNDQTEQKENNNGNNSTTDELKSNHIHNSNISGGKRNGIELWKELVLGILRNTMCYALMPDSGKVVVFDSTLPVKHAFRALAENDIKCAPVWHSTINKGEGDFIGFMTVTDFADILHYYSQDLNSFSRKIGELEGSTVGRWCTFRKKHHKAEISRAFVYAEPDEPIFNAIYKMHQYFIHRMPVKHNKSILCILNHQTILRFVFNKTKEHHASLNIRVGDLEYKTDQQHFSVTYDQKVSDAISILSQNRQVSAIPICEKDSGIVKDAFMRSDIRFFARNQAYLNLNVTIKDFLSKFRPMQSGQYVPICRESDNLLHVLMEMLNKRCHVAVVLDEKKKLLAIFNYYQIFTQIISAQHMNINQEQQEIANDHLTNNLLNDSNDINNHFKSND